MMGITAPTPMKSMNCETRNKTKELRVDGSNADKDAP